MKDVFAISGETACFGNPTWLATHEAATVTSDAVERLLAAGATLDGVTSTDELALSLTGENPHYGTPINPRCPERVPGGSSSGSAVAVAAALVDFALGTDTGGSVRVPASHNGICGMRPTWGSVSSEGVLPLAPRFDTVGWFARSPELLARVGAVLLPRPAMATTMPPIGLVALADAEEVMRAEAWDAVCVAMNELAAALSVPLEWNRPSAGAPAVASWVDAYLPLQNEAIAAVHGTWGSRRPHPFGALVGDRFERALRTTADQVRAAEALRASIVARVLGLMAHGAWVILPTAAGVAPLRGEVQDRVDAFTLRSLALSAGASLAGLPQVTLPAATGESGCPLGVSLLGPPGSDASLLAAAVRAAPRINVDGF